MDSELVHYLKKFRDDSSQYTHTSQMVPTSGVYLITNQNLKTFYELYCSRLDELQDQFMSGIAERPGKYMPVLADIDIKIPCTEDVEIQGHFYTRQQLERIVAIYNDLLLQLIGNDRLQAHHMYCFVLEKTAPYKCGGYIKNGFHLHWPFIYLKNSDQEIHLLPRVKAVVQSEKIFADLDIENSGDVLDTNISSKHWLMYGSRKDVVYQAYQLTDILTPRLQSISLQEVLQHNPIYDNHDNIIPMSEHELPFYLPIILSVHCYGRPIYKVKPGTECLVKQTLHRAVNCSATYEQMSMPETIALVRRLMTMINAKRTDHHDTWMEVGWCLFNITQGCLEGLDIWIQFSMNAERRTHVDEARCTWEWNRMKPRKFTVGSLRMWAKIDNPEAYEEFCQQQQQKRIDQSLQGGHADLAKMLYDKYKGQFVCASIKDNLWYHFHKHRWRETQNGDELYKKIDTDLVPKFVEESKRKLDEMKAHSLADAEIQNKITQASVKQFMKTIANLKSAPFRENLMRICRHDFYDPNFLENLDENVNLLGFENGVLDLTTCTFRDGYPEDYISKSCEYDFKQFSSNEDPEIIEVMHFWLKVLTKRDVRESFLEYCGSLLKGGNDDQKFLILSGVGANGKTMAIDLISQTLGKYAIKFPTTLLTGKEASSSGCSPELMRAKGCRFADISEPEGSVPINVGIMKRLTGNEKVYSRGLYEKGEDWRPQFKLAYICNKLPKLPQDDNGTWRRILLYIFQSYFPGNDSLVPATWQEQYEKRIFLRDRQFVSKISNMRQAMMWIMVQYYKKIARRKTHPPLPKEVTSAIDLYRQENDYFLQFSSQMMKQDPSAFITFNDFYTAFKTWFSESYGAKPPNKNDVRLEMQQKPQFGELTKDSKWIGWRMRCLQDDVADGQTMMADPNDLIQQSQQH